MRPASTFWIIQLSNSRVEIAQKKLYMEGTKTFIRIFQKNLHLKKNYATIIELLHKQHKCGKSRQQI